MCRFYLFTALLVYLVILDVLVTCEGSYRLPRSSSKTNNEEFEKFFLKASKSVPRIGRRGSVNDNYYSDGVLNGGTKYQLLRNPYAFPPKRSTNKNLGAPFWSDIAQIYEYNPELPDMMEYLSSFEQQGDDPSVYDMNKMKFKKGKTVPNKEALEYRLQAEV